MGKFCKTKIIPWEQLYGRGNNSKAHFQTKKKEKEKLKNDQQYQGITKGLPVQKETEEGIAPFGETPKQSKKL